MYIIDKLGVLSGDVAGAQKWKPRMRPSERARDHPLAGLVAHVISRPGESGGENSLVQLRPHLPAFAFQTVALLLL